jgi:hypothetical protein
VSVYIDVWHRTHPLTPEAHARFLDYYGTTVVAPPSDFFEVVGGFRYTDGPSNEDFALYRYASMAKIEESMMSFGADADFVAATEALFRDVEIEETRGIAIHASYSPEERLDEIISESPGKSRRYIRSVRTCRSASQPGDFRALGQLRDQIEKGGRARLVTAFQYLVGPVMDIVEIWILAEGENDFSNILMEVDRALQSKLSGSVPERERRGIEPTAFSKLR